MSTAFEIRCTGCAYCSDRCPLDLPIPQYFALYNEAMRAETASEKEAVLERYQELAAEGKKAGDCLRCGQCEGFCPEHLPVAGFLQDVAEEFEDF